MLMVTNDDDIAALADRTLRLRDGVISTARRHSCRSASIGASLTARQVG